MDGGIMDNMSDVDMLKDFFRSRKIGVRGDCPTCKDTAGINTELIFLLQNMACRKNVGDAAHMAKRALIILGVEPNEE